MDTNCVDFSADQTSEDWKEQVAVCDEQVMEAYLEGEEISRVQIQKMIWERKLFPMLFRVGAEADRCERIPGRPETSYPGVIVSGKFWGKDL